MYSFCIQGSEWKKRLPTEQVSLAVDNEYQRISK